MATLNREFSMTLVLRPALWAVTCRYGVLDFPDCGSSRLSAKVGIARPAVEVTGRVTCITVAFTDTSGRELGRAYRFVCNDCYAGFRSEASRF